ncbi:hypothetical protein M900_2767 [Bacteriovorax sp. Seq25_V]|nr:hypothetical protein M900_2767 [Bacteriovorax sp. Seq25_V]
MSLIFIGLVQFVMVAVAMIVLVLTTTVDSYTTAFYVAVIAWSGYLVASEYIFLFFYNVKSAQLGSDLREIINNFSYRNDDRDVIVYSSSTCPLVMRVGLLNGAKILINQEELENYSKEEIISLIDLELSYSKTLASLVEVLIQKIYFVTWFPLDQLLGKILDGHIVKYVLSPFTGFYRVIIKNCRSSFIYTGKFVTTLPQIVFKAKISTVANERIPLLGYSYNNLEHMVSAENRIHKDVTRFNLDEIVR